MMVHIIGLSVFLVLFVLSTMRPVSMGILGFAAAFIVGLIVLGQTARETIAGFPVDLFVILVGVTLLFGIAQANGTVALLVNSGVRLIRGRVALLPWLMFALSAILCGIGALGPAVVSILFPIGMAFAASHRINPVLISMMVGFGAVAGGFSPLGIYGIIVNQALGSEGLAIDGGQLSLIVFLAALVAAVIAYLAAGGPQLIRSSRTTAPEPDAVDADGGGGGGASAPSALHPDARSGRAVAGSTDLLTDETRIVTTTLEQRCTIGALVVLVVGAVGFDLDIGLLAMTLAAVLGLVFSSSIARATQHISWNVVLLLGGVVTYVGVLDQAGTIDWLGQVASGIGTPLVAALVICYIAGGVSAFASTTGMLGALVPLCIPLLEAGHIGVLGFAAALSLSSSLVDTSPFSTVGAVAIASAPEAERQRVYRSLLRIGLGLVVVAPLASWAVLVAPGWL